MTPKTKALGKAKENTNKKAGIYDNEGKRYPREEQEKQRMLYAVQQGKGFKVTKSSRGKEGIEILK